VVIQFSTKRGRGQPLAPCAPTSNVPGVTGKLQIVTNHAVEREERARSPSSRPASFRMSAIMYVVVDEAVDAELHALVDAAEIILQPQRESRPARRRAAPT
jgi:hypothetical protein